uniref:hypothetical protein n=1 Tax=uncultured Draconibacterium sp. TaxID=1573823 RepID=UPI0032180E64
MTKYKLILLFLIVFGLNATACRFTVREIGFSILSQDIYTLAVIDAHANPKDEYWQKYHQQNKDCNIRLEILHPENDSEHPVVVAAKDKRLSFPATVLVSPNRRVFVLKDSDFSHNYSRVINSFLRERMRRQYPDVFAVVFWIQGKDATLNEIFAKKVEQECADIENIIPSMPKLVKHGPVAMKVSSNDFLEESLLLWSLGVETQPEEPIAFVLYGRGRIMGEALNYTQVMDGGLYKYMSMIGADCECGLDKKWMLGNQIPLLWDKVLREYLAKVVDVDVDNPMILAEMSRILAKESLEDATGSVAFAPETIDLDAVWGNTLTVKKVVEAQDIQNKTGKMLIYTIIFVLVIIFGVAGSILLRKQK